jgi:hypothetical protein
VALRTFELGIWLGSPKGGERKHGMGGNTTRETRVRRPFNEIACQRSADSSGLEARY